MTRRRTTLGAALLLMLPITACRTPSPTAAPTSAVSAGGAATPAAALPPEVAAYLNTALDLIQANSIYGATADWPTIRGQAAGAAAAAGAKTTSDVYAALQLALHLTGDRHGYVMPPVDAAGYTATVQAPLLPEIQHRIVSERLALLVVPAFSNGDPRTVEEFAELLQDAIRELDAARPCGWIVDVRYNEGGNGFAMLAGVMPLLGEGTYGYYAYPHGRREPWHRQGNGVALRDVTLVEVERPYVLGNPQAPVAVLTSEVTTSAGEMVAIAFRGRQGARSFGWPTLGRTTAPQGFPLSDGAMLGVSVAYFADRTGRVYEGAVVPDEALVAHDDPVYRSREVPQAAIDWLLAQEACRVP